MAVLLLLAGIWLFYLGVSWWVESGAYDRTAIGSGFQSVAGLSIASLFVAAAWPAGLVVGLVAASRGSAAGVPLLLISLSGVLFWLGFLSALTAAMIDAGVGS